LALASQVCARWDPGSRSMEVLLGKSENRKPMGWLTMGFYHVFTMGFTMKLDDELDGWGFR